MLKVTARSHSVAAIVIIARRGKSLRMITKRKKAVKRSKYKCVYWNKASSKWRAEKKVKGKTHNLGFFTDQHEAARAVKKFCESHDIPHVDISVPLAADNAVSTRSVRKKAVKQSKYKGVSWSKATSKWLAQKTVKGKNHHLGYFTTALAAARKVNAFCKSQGIALANNLPVPKKKTSNRKTKRNTQRVATCVPKRKQRHHRR